MTPGGALRELPCEMPPDCLLDGTPAEGPYLAMLDELCGEGGTPSYSEAVEVLPVGVRSRICGVLGRDGGVAVASGKGAVWPSRSSIALMAEWRRCLASASLASFVCLVEDGRLLIATGLTSPWRAGRSRSGEIERWGIIPAIFTEFFASVPTCI